MRLGLGAITTLGRTEGRPRYFAAVFFAIAAAAALCSGCRRDAGIERVEWPVMGTVAAVQTRAAAAGVAGAVRAVFSDVERLLNAHDPKSELSRLAALPDAEILAKCDPSVKPCYETAFRLTAQSGGVFNPRWKGPGTMDLGAIAKGFAVDLAAASLAAKNAENGERGKTLIDLGGNLKAVDGEWKVGVASGTTASGASTFDLPPGHACATSAKYYRGNHIKDGRTGGDVTNSVYSVTVVHPSSAMLADGLSTICFILGRDEGEAFLRRYYPDARAIWNMK